jgi:acetyl-CoA carboxylase biotin carboxylase subunit
MIAKVIVYGNDRQEAIQRMNRALEEFYVSPIKTTIGLHLEILNNPQFLKGEITTHFLDKMALAEMED